MSFPRGKNNGIMVMLSAFEFVAAIKKHDELKWILQCDEESNEMKDFLKLIKRIRKLYVDNISMDKAVELFPTYEFNTAFPWGYCNEIAYIIMAQLKYKPWNQYYYSHMNNERLTQMIEWAYKEYRKRALEESITQDFQ